MIYENRRNNIYIIELKELIDIIRIKEGGYILIGRVKRELRERKKGFWLVRKERKTFSRISKTKKQTFGKREE